MLSSARTTVTLDPDTEEIVRQRMAASGASFKRALNAAIREGAAGRREQIDFHTPTFAMGVPLVDLDGGLQVAGKLEDAELVRRMRVGK